MKIPTLLATRYSLRATAAALLLASAAFLTSAVQSPAQESATVKHLDAATIEYAGKRYIESAAQPKTAPAVEIVSLTQVKIDGEAAGDLVTALLRHPEKHNAILDALEALLAAKDAEIAALKTQLATAEEARAEPAKE